MSGVVVLGAGPAGLLAALEARERGHEVTLLEAAPVVGGMAGSFEFAGHRVDHGSHRLHPAVDPRVMQRISELLRGDLQRRERNGRIRLRDRWVGFPLRMADMARSLPPGFVLRVARDSLSGPLRRPRGETFAAAIEQRLGPTVLREFYGPYVRKLYGEPADRLHRELADRRVAASSLRDVAVRMIGAARSDGRTFYAPRRGYGQITEALAAEAVRIGVDLRTSTPVSRVEQRSGGLRVEAGAAAGFDADVVLSSIPTPALARALRPGPPTLVLEALDQMRTRSMVLVYLAVATSQYTEFDAHYFPESLVGVARLSEPKNYRDGDDPVGHTVLCAEIACWRGDPVWNASDADLAAMVVDDLGRAGLPAVEVLELASRRLSSVYPVYDLDSITARSRVDDWAASLERIVVFGRQGLGVPDNLHHVLSMGAAAAAALGDEATVDRRKWRASLDEFATHVVQD